MAENNDQQAAAAAAAAAATELAKETAATLAKVNAETSRMLDSHERSHNDLMGRLLERTETQARDISEIKALLSGKYVTLDAFTPVKALVYGCVAALLLSGLGVLVKSTLGG